MTLPLEFTFDYSEGKCQCLSYGPEHVDRVVALEETCFQDPWSRGLLEAEARHAEKRWNLVLLCEDELVGYALHWQMAEELHLLNIAIEPSWRRKGLSSGLIRTVAKLALERGFSHMILEVRESNEAARALYESLGFLYLHRRKAYYTDSGEDALVLWLPLEAEIKEEE
ncbi:MAG: ribosomal protein S18-alanine N-acetyltransferase [Candidatus Krumholzibacteria bacterium]|nr:ribosomal protein S18-alanine N-acetyltransferase [Candidatus Krumholzibacteria bacterium]MDP7022485.1 ribosomal protein S18-alanine N-acetyltransferase [Candidatus Krumholzibacteria bacterium]